MIQHKGTNSIETLRLKLRRFEEWDADDMFRNWAADPEVCRYLFWGPHPSIEITRRRVKDWHQKYRYPHIYVWGIELKRRGQLIGSISVELADDKNRTCEVGYCIGKEYWNRGIMTEALLAVMHYLFYEIGYRTIVAKHDVQNLASGRVMQKAGMHFDRIERNVGLRKDGTYYDLAVYSKNYLED